MPTSSQFKILHTVKVWKKGTQLPPILEPEHALHAEEQRKTEDLQFSFSKLDLKRIIRNEESKAVQPTTNDGPENSKVTENEKTPPEDSNSDKPPRQEAFTQSKRMLSNLGFRGLPGHRVQNEDRKLLKNRPGIATRQKSVHHNESEDDGITPEMMNSMNTAILIDFSCLDQSTLRPTSVCFDVKPGFTITHASVWIELKKIIAEVSTVVVENIEYSYRRITHGPHEDDRWTIKTNSVHSRNILSGRELTLGIEPNRGSFLLRRYDDMLLLEFKRNARATAWGNVLGNQPKVKLSDTETKQKKMKTSSNRKKGRKSKSRSK